MSEAILYLKDGQRRAVIAPVGGAFHEILYYMRVPAAGAGKMVRLQVPAGDAVEVAANDIARIEVAPPHALIRDFLSDAELAQVEAFTVAQAAAFQASGVHEAPDQAGEQAGSPYGIRRSRVLDGPANGAMAALMLPKVQAVLPELWTRWRMTPQALTALECQVTAHGDGDFFAVHTDNGMPEIAHRRISYVFYFHREPKPYSGGHLALYHTAFEGGYGKCGGLAADIDPPRNGLMVFPTFIFHEVTPIRCGSSALMDQRLTLNGWLF